MNKIQNIKILASRQSIHLAELTDELNQITYVVLNDGVETDFPNLVNALEYFNKAIRVHADSEKENLIKQLDLKNSTGHD